VKTDGLYLAGVGAAVHAPARAVEPDLDLTAGVTEPDPDLTAGVTEPDPDLTAGTKRPALDPALGAPEPALDLAVRAARTAVRRSGHAARDFGALLHTTSSPQLPARVSAPHYLLHRTLDRAVTAAELRQGRLGMLSALGLCAHLLGAAGGPDAVLLTGAESEPTASGTALVVSRRGGFARVLAVGEQCDPRRFDPHTAADRSWPLLCAEIEERVLAEAEVARDALARVVTGEPAKDTGVNDLAMELEQLWSAGELIPGDRVLLSGATPGLEAGRAVLEITAQPQGQISFNPMEIPS
jgi:3-oxoacyl-[acyl-carrier-protein] synthase-3